MRCTDRRHRNVSGGERGGVVQAVANHHYPEALLLQLLHPRDLVGGGYACAPLCDPQGLRRRPHGWLTIAREHLDGDSRGLERGDDLLRIGTELLPDRKHISSITMAETCDRYFRIQV